MVVNDKLPVTRVNNLVEDFADINLAGAGLLSNCTVDAPTTIKMEYSGSSLTIKEGTLVQIPNGRINGVKQYIEYTLQNDITNTDIATLSTGTEMIALGSRADQIYHRLTSTVYIQSSQPTVTSASAAWFDTVNNYWFTTYDTGATWEQVLISPLGRVYYENSVIYNLDVFNGAAYYINNTVVVKKNTEFLIPDGIDERGKNKVITYVSPENIVTNFTTEVSDAILWLTSTGGLSVFSISQTFIQPYYPNSFQNMRWLNTQDNTWYDSSDWGTTWTKQSISMLLDIFSTDSNGKVTRFGLIKPAILAVKNDIENSLTNFQISNCVLAAPDFLYLSTSGSTLTVKAGSRILIPRGLDSVGNQVYQPVVLSQDISRTFTEGTLKRYIACTGSVINTQDDSKVFVSATAPISPVQDTWWYDTANNKFVYWTGSLWTPINGNFVGYIEISNNTITKCKSFNGSAWAINNTLIVPRGVASLLPIGISSLGRLNSASILTTNCSYYELPTGVRKNYAIGLDESNNIQPLKKLYSGSKPIDTSLRWYDNINNTMYEYSGSTWNKVSTTTVGYYSTDATGKVIEWSNSKGLTVTNNWNLATMAGELSQTLFQDILSLEPISGPNIVLENNKIIYLSIPTANIQYKINSDLINKTNSAYTFELAVKMPSTIVSLDFVTLNNVQWLNDEAPDTSTAGKMYLFAFRSMDNGISWIGNLQGFYTEYTS